MCCSVCCLGFVLKVDVLVSWSYRLGLGLEVCCLGLGLSLEGRCLGLGLGLEC